MFRASLAVARIPTADSQQCRYLHLHLWGTALSFYLGLTQAQQDDLEQSLRCLRNRYAGADKRRNFEFELNNRKFDPAKEDADDFLTDLQRLAELSIVDVPASTGVAAIDRSDERTRKVREQFIQGMPFKYKKALLKEDEDSNVTDLCKIIKRRLRADKLQPEVEPLTAFNEIEISQNSTSDLMNAIAQIEAKQDQLQQQFVQQNQQNYDSQNYDQSQHFWNPQNNYPRQPEGIRTTTLEERIEVEATHEEAFRINLETDRKHQDASFAVSVEKQDICKKTVGIDNRQTGEQICLSANQKTSFAATAIPTNRRCKHELRRRNFITFSNLYSF